MMTMLSTPRSRSSFDSLSRHLRLGAAVIAIGATVIAQGPPPPPPPPPPPLQPPPVPPGNPITPNKTLLGKALFWDEQLSATGTVACGTCHIPASGGADPRATPANAASTNPGPDQLFGTPDDISASPGVINNNDATNYVQHALFGLKLQTTGRKAPSMINAAYSPLLFWDGRASGTFVDPQTNQVVLPNGGALESQSVAPPMSDVEMGSIGRTWDAITARLAASRPLALSPALTPDLASFVANRSYPELFTLAFGTPEITSARIALSIATYQRTLFSNQAPIDQLQANPGALTPLENQGRGIFGSPQTNCVICHAGPRLTNETFQYIGVRPQDDDLGRFNVTGLNGDRGRMRVPSLRNVELRSSFFHNGRFTTLEQVVDFYDRGGDFNGPNKNPLIHPLGLTVQQKQALVAFLRRPLTDPRVAAQTAPFDHPALYAGSARQPVQFGAGTPGAGGFIPSLIAIEPPSIGNPSFTLGLEHGLGGAQGVLLLDTASNPFGVPFQGTPVFVAMSSNLIVLRTGHVRSTGAGNGWDSFSVALPSDPGLIGTSLFGQWLLLDSSSGGRFSATPGFQITLF